MSVVSPRVRRLAFASVPASLILVTGCPPTHYASVPPSGATAKSQPAIAPLEASLYGSAQYWVRLSPEATIDDLKRMDAATGLPLSTAQYRTFAIMPHFVVIFPEKYGNPYEVCRRMERLPLVEEAYPTEIQYVAPQQSAAGTP